MKDKFSKHVFKFDTLVKYPVYKTLNKRSGSGSLHSSPGWVAPLHFSEPEPCTSPDTTFKFHQMIVVLRMFNSNAFCSWTWTWFPARVWFKQQRSLNLLCWGGGWYFSLLCTVHIVFKTVNTLASEVEIKLVLFSSIPQWGTLFSLSGMKTKIK